MRLLRSRLFQPGLNCPNCHTLFLKNGIRPPCVVKRGSCPIEDVAGSVPLNRKVNSFLEAEMFELSPGYAPVQRKILKESGLFSESPHTLLEMRSVLAEYKDWASKQKK